MDPGDRVVVAVDDAGDVRALTIAAGMTKWAATLAVATVTTPPVIAGGFVYIAAQDGTVTALAESSGVAQWSSALGATVTASPALNGAYLLVGTGAGNVVYLSTATGAVAATQVIGPSPITGVVATIGITIVSTGNEFALTRGINGVKVEWNYILPSGTASAPVVLNGDVFATGGSTSYGFSIPGVPIT